jgi:penicillin G amidase
MNDPAQAGTTTVEVADPARAGRAPRPLWNRRWARWTALGLSLTLSAAALLMLGVWMALRASLPAASGSVALPGLAAPVSVTRDAAGIPVITGESEADVLRGLGFVHAQERYFQMDLMRRSAAGELAELFGAEALAFDRQQRARLYREQALRIWGELPLRHRELLTAYAEGVNAGLAALSARPPEYLLLRQRPAPWAAEDALLGQLRFFDMLSGNPTFEARVGTMALALPPELVAFLTPDLTRFDAPVITPPGDETGGYVPLAIPSARVVDLRQEIPSPREHRAVRVYGDLIPGSNAWAVAGSRTAHGEALAANDPHLGISVPNTWFRAELVWEGRHLRGASVPGVPGIVLGSSDRLTWGFTNSLVDQVDLVVVEVDRTDPRQYLTPEGREPFSRFTEVIAVRGGEGERLEVRATRWGPVVGEDARGRPLALRSPVYDPGRLNMGLLEMAHARTLEEGVEILRSWYGPAQSAVLADADGRVAWLITGFLPDRRGFDGKRPVSWALGDVGWDGALDEELRPVVTDPPAGFVFHANQRPVPAEWSRRLGRVWGQPSRAMRARELLESRGGVGELDMLAMQLDTRSLEHDPLRDLVLEIVTPRDPDPKLRRIHPHVAAWNGTADADQPGFRILQLFAQELREQILGSLLLPVVGVDSTFVYNWPLAFEPLHRVLDERPAHFLPAGWGDWNAYLRGILLAAVAPLEHDRGRPGLDAPWGEVNRASFRHPLSRAVPQLSRFLDLPADALPGWPGTLRAQSPVYGASLRMTASPTRPAAAIFQMPGGQSGHFLSRHFRDGHRDWVEGKRSPFAAGQARSTLRLVPRNGGG